MLDLAFAAFHNISAAVEVSSFHSFIFAVPVGEQGGSVV